MTTRLGDRGVLIRNALYKCAKRTSTNVSFPSFEWRRFSFIKMTYTDDFRWRALTLHFMYGIPVKQISELLGPKPRTIMRWYKQFNEYGTVHEKKERVRSSRWPSEVLTFVKQYVSNHPTFYIEELQKAIASSFPHVHNVSPSTICRALRFDLHLSRKTLTKAAREAKPEEIKIYKAKLKAIYSYPEQMVFIDETSKDGRSAYRRYGWSQVNKKAVVRLPFSRGKRVSIIAAMDCNGFMSWKTTPDTFARKEFHEAFEAKIIPHLNPWPGPRSIVVMDNARIHMYLELQDAIHQTGARLLFLPPYSPELNPIEIGFGLLKGWIQKNANLVFPLFPAEVLGKEESLVFILDICIS